MTFKDERYAKDHTWAMLTMKIEEARDAIESISAARKSYASTDVMFEVLTRAKYEYVDTLMDLLRARSAREAKLDEAYIKESISIYGSCLNDYEHEFNHYGMIRGTRL